MIEIEFGRTILTVKVKLLKEHVLKDESTMLYDIVWWKKKRSKWIRECHEHSLFSYDVEEGYYG